MATVDQASNETSLNSLYSIRSMLYRITVEELNALPPSDQRNYTQSLHQISLAIEDLENAKMQQVNDAFKDNEQTLVAKTQGLQQAVQTLSESVDIINTVSNAIGLIATITKLATA